MALPADEARHVLEAADLVCPAAAIDVALDRLAREITAALAGRFPLALCVMRGAVVFAGQLLPRLPFPLELDYVDVTRYGDATRGGALRWRSFPERPMAGRAVLVVDDILDEGRTLAAIRERLQASGAATIHCAVLAEKETGRARFSHADFVGVRVPDRYVFGFGMDVGGAWRNLPALYALKDGAPC